MAARGTATNRALAVNRALSSNRQKASGRLNVLGGGGGGGGGADLTNTATLPAPGSADPTVIYHLTTDDHCYMLNAAGTAMVPVELPGWSRVDGANDQEWEGSNSDPPSGWAYQTQADWAANVNNTRKSCLVLTQSVFSGNFTLLYQTATITTTNKTVYAVLEVVSSAGISNPNGRAGIGIRNSSNGRSVVVYAEYGNISVNLRQTDLVDATTGTHNFNSAQGMLPMNHPFVFAISNDGTNLTFKFAPLYGGAFSDLTTIWTETLASFLTQIGGAADQICYMMNMNTSGQTLKIISDWIRVV